jgi:hypothetical protein
LIANKGVEVTFPAVPKVLAETAENDDFKFLIA